MSMSASALFECSDLMSSIAIGSVIISVYRALACMCWTVNFVAEKRKCYHGHLSEKRKCYHRHLSKRRKCCHGHLSYPSISCDLIPHVLCQVSDVKFGRYDV